MTNPREIRSLTSLLPDLDDVPESLIDEAIWDSFTAWTRSKNITLYPAQEEAALAALAGDNVIVATPTGSGKSMVAIAAHFFALARGQRSFYTAPIKALVSEKFFSLCEYFGPENVGMMTGDASVAGSLFGARQSSVRADVGNPRRHLVAGRRPTAPHWSHHKHDQWYHPACAS